MNKKRIFVGSSGEAKTQANVLIKEFARDDIEWVPWWNEFTPGRTLLTELDRIKTTINGAVLLFTPDSPATIRDSQVAIPNLNVMFEFGYFYSHLGNEKTAMIKYGKVYLPSDLAGYIHITGSGFFKPKHSVKPGKKTTKDFNNWFSHL